ncbi:LacI family DNA-binding transcriptional regulator [Vagococcus bubulae]|uniref:LacI family transcriptional regulator n=1 Tax=Vagococcus bubulae TaxID=1977868 RepID=A0A429ZD02_9ENTE|nr:LacI family DNA-binding transcriptional regulator [Vagococcus bubulae]RST91553.1 LacI family transcriptional regulator [Vagococcus bubulae]
MATISDIAKKTNLSISTISRVLNYDTTLSVTDETKRRVFEAAEQLNYQKHTKKFDKRKKETLTKSILILQWLDTKEELEDIYYMSIRIGVEKRAEELGMNIIKTSQVDDTLADNVHGVIAIGKFDASIIKKISQLHKNVCFIGTNYPLREFDSVNGDFALATELAIDHLIELGHKNIGFIGVEEKKNLYGHRQYKAPTTYTFVDYMSSLQLFNDDFFFFIHSDHHSTQLGELLIQQAIDSLDGRLPSAFVVSHDAMAVGVIKKLTEKGFNVPNDISIVSINDIAVAPFVSPALTTVKIYTEAMGESAVDLISDRIDGEKIARRVMLAPRLIVRESTGKAN